MRVIAIGNVSGSNTRSWLVDQDCLLQGAIASSGNQLISENPASVTTDVSTPATGNRTDWLVWLSSGSGVGSSPLGIQLKIPLFVGRTLYVAFTGGGFCFLYLDDVVSAE